VKSTRDAIVVVMVVASVLAVAVPPADALRPEGPIVSSVSPNTGQGAKNWAVLVRGGGFAPGAVLSFAGTGVTAQTTTFFGEDTLKALITVAPDAATGIRGATVTNPDGSSGTCEACFTVDSGPKPTSAVPSTGARGETLIVELSGSGFRFHGSVRFTSGVSVIAVRFRGDGELDVTISIAPGAAPGARDATVLNSADGGLGVCFGCFSVTP